MLNNIHFAALHVLMYTMSSFTISSQGCLVKFEAVLMLLIGFLSHLPLTLPDLKTSENG